MEEINNVSGQQPETTKTLTKANFLLMVVSVVMIIVGFLLMGGEPRTYEEINHDIFSTVRIAVGPTISFLGFVLMFFAILYKKK